MKCPLCQGRINFGDGARLWLQARVHCRQCATTFRITAPGQTAFLRGLLLVFVVGAGVLGVVFFADFWAGIIGIACLALLLVLLEFLTYHFYSRYGRLHEV
jgi:hypothetical protein